MSLQVLNSYATATEHLEYPVDQNVATYSTIPYEETTPVVDIAPDEEENNELFGSHIREAVAIVKDWTSNK